MVSSIDGRLLVERWTPAASSMDHGSLHQQYENVAARFDADGWIVGRKTMESFARGTARTSQAKQDDRRDTFIAEHEGRDLAIEIDPHGKLHYAQNDAGGDHIVAVLGELVPDDYLAELILDRHCVSSKLPISTFIG